MPESNPRVAIITARGGSKRIPGKNLKAFLGRPILAYSIDAALESRLFDEVIVSTDDPAISEVARNYGATVPFMRSASASDDYATTADALLDVLNAYQQLGRKFVHACCIYPTAPFVTAEKLKDAFRKLEAEKLDTVFPVMPFSYPVFRSLKMENGKLEMIWNQYRNSRSQDLPQAFHDAGQFYFFCVQAFLEKKALLTDNVGGIIINELEGQDIDNMVDWQLAEMKYQLLKQKHE